MNEVLFRGSKDRAVDEAKKVRPTKSLIIWCCITLLLLPGGPGHSSGIIKGSLAGTFVVSGLSLSFYRSWKMPKVSDFSLSDEVMHEPVVGIKSSPPGSWLPWNPKETSARHH